MISNFENVQNCVQTDHLMGTERFWVKLRLECAGRIFFLIYSELFRL